MKKAGLIAGIAAAVVAVGALICAIIALVSRQRD